MQRRGAIVFILITIMLDMLSLGLIAPVFAKLVVQFTGSAMTAAGYVGAFGIVWAAMQFVFSPLLGMLSDRVGRRPVILISNAATALDNAIMALAPSIPWLFVGRVISGGATASISVASAYIADITEPEKRAQAFGLIGSAFGLGFILGPAIGGLLGNFGPRVPFWAAVAFSLVNFLYGLLVLPESLKPEHRTASLDWKRANPFGSLHLLRRHREIYGLTAVKFTDFIAHEVYPTVWVLYCIAVFGWSSAQIGLSLALVGLTSALSSALLVGPIVSRLGERKTLLAGLAVAALANAMLGTASAIVFLGGIIVGALALYSPPAIALLSRRVGPSEQGELQGALACVRGISMMIGPGLFAGVFALFMGPWRSLHLQGAPWYLASLLMLIALLIAWRVTGREDDVVLAPPAPAPPLLVEEP
jgi:DHA1 family tetracycline resistance protein-like MFS transporter